MEPYNVDFGIAGLIVLALFIGLNFSKRRLNTYSDRCYNLITIFVLLADFLDVLTAFLHNYGPFVIAEYVTNILLFLLLSATMITFPVYILSLLKVRILQKKALFHLMIVPITILALAVITTPFTGLIFTVTEQDGYRFGPGHDLIYLLPVITLVSSFLLLVVNRKKLGKRQLLACFSFIFSAILGTAVQGIFFPHTLLAWFFCSIAAIIISNTMQRPDVYIDHLTGVFNLEGMAKVIEERLDADGDKSRILTVCLKSDCAYLRDTYGMSVCDNFLRTAANLLDKIPHAKVFRGDSRFYVLVKGAEACIEAAEGIEMCFSGEWPIEGITHSVRAKLLRLVLNKDVHGFADVLRLSEFFENEYSSAANGHFFSGSDLFAGKARRRETIKNIVREAIATEGIDVFYQPIYSTEKNDIHSAEALVRLKDTKTLGYISPEEFIPIAENENLIIPLEGLIMKKICAFTKNCDLQKMGISYIEVNLSGKNCARGNLSRELSTAMNEYGIAPNFFNFEITETSIIDDVDNLRSAMNQLIDAGSGFSLDDYGTGYANIQYLIDYPFVLVKLDKSVVMSYINAEDSKKCILPATVEMLKNMGLKIVAEGVETEEQKRLLESLGVHYLQGYYFSKPVSEEKFLEYVREANGTVRV